MTNNVGFSLYGLYLLGIVCYIMLSCEHSNQVEIASASAQNIEQESRDSAIERDSLKEVTILNGALHIAYEHIDDSFFYTKYTIPADSFSLDLEVGINLGFFFSNTQKHLILSSSDYANTVIKVYAIRGSNFENVVTYSELYKAFINDTIQDVNGDGFSDFVVNSHGKTGCCLKNFSSVFLLREDELSFSREAVFINPTFFPDEHIIRGICYGHPGDTELYKFKWNKENVDTIEYVFFEKNARHMNTGRLIISRERLYNDKLQYQTFVHGVPLEYRGINYYDWFTGEGYNLPEKQARGGQ